MSTVEVLSALKRARGLDGVTNPDATEEELARIASTFTTGGFFNHSRAHLDFYLAAQGVAAHPNAPLQALINLAPFFPLEVASNPALELQLAVSDVTRGYERTENLFALAPTRAISQALLSVLESLWYGGARYRGDILALQLAQHPGLSPALLVEAADDMAAQAHGATDVFYRNHRNYPGEHDPTPYEESGLFYQLGAVPVDYPDALAYLAHNRLIAPEAAAACQAVGLAPEYTTDVVDAYHPDTPEDWRASRIDALSKHGLKHASPTTQPLDWGLNGLPRDAAHVLALRHMRYANAMVGLTADLPERVTRHLLWDPDPRVRASLALNPTTPRWAITALLDDANSRVRATAKQHPHATPC